MAGRAGTGVRMNLDHVPVRESGMTPYEIMLSESQERMLIVAHKGQERQVVDIFKNWDLDAVVIGRVTDTSRVQLVCHEGTVADIPVGYLTDEAPLYERPMRAPKRRDAGEASEDKDVAVGGGIDIVSPAPPTAPVFDDDEQRTQTSDDGRRTTDNGLRDHADSLRLLLASPNVASKEWAYRQYDHMVRTNTAVLPGADAAVVRIKETRRALAMCLDGNGRYCAADPREGAKLVVAEAARNVVCVGARPLAVTNCLNFASPERPEVMWAFSEVIDGMAEACLAFDTPVISGNVSFYNETEGRGILPTPVIGMVGLIEEVSRIVQPGFKAEGDTVVLLGETRDDLSISEYAATVEGRTTDEMIARGRVPALSLELEKRVQEACLRLAAEGLLRSAHDCSDGGLAVAVAESCFSTLNRPSVGVDLALCSGTLPVATYLFAESPSRIVVSFDPEAGDRVHEIAEELNCPVTLLGTVGGERLAVKVNGAEEIDAGVNELEQVWRGSLSSRLRAEASAASSAD
ncbi:MAG: AIR synthase-related protein [Pyrinomonadaceae bacterium]